MKVITNGNTTIVSSFETYKVDRYQVHSIEVLEDTFLVVFAQ